MKRITKLDLTCLLLFLALLAVTVATTPWAREQGARLFNPVPNALLLFWIRPALLMLGGYCFQWLLAGFFTGEPQLRPGVQTPLLAVCALLTLSWPVLAALHWGVLGFTVSWTYPLVLLYADQGLGLFPFMIGAGWYAATRRGPGHPTLM